jgi:hypothetical protein
LAVGYYGEPRATGDIDVNVFVEGTEWPRVRKALAPLQVEVEPAEQELEQSEVRLEWGGTPLHLFFSCDQLHEQMRQGVCWLPFNGATIPLVSAEHLVIRKAILNRPKDWHDIEQILVASYPLQLGTVREWLQGMTSEGDGRVTKLGEIETALDLA